MKAKIVVCPHCGRSFDTRVNWQNNLLNKIFWDEFPRSFTLEDIDGITHCYISPEKKEEKIKIVIYDTKNASEKIGGQQLRLLYILKMILHLLTKVYNVKEFDEKSAVYIIRFPELEQGGYLHKQSKLGLSDIVKDKKEKEMFPFDPKAYSTISLETVTVNDFYNIITGKY